MYRNLKCPNCSETILASDINLNKGLAKCSYCNVIFNIGEDSSDDSSTPQRKDEIFVIPKGIEILKLFGELNIEMSWRHSIHWFIILFTLIWNAILLPFILVAIFTQEYFILLFISLHLAVGIGLLYFTLSSLFNKTYITVDKQTLTIEHRPFSLFFKEHHLEVKDIDQLYVKKYVSSRTNGNPNYSYVVMAILRNKEEIKLVKGISKPPQALYIEQEIESFAGIQDKPIAEEI